MNPVLAATGGAGLGDALVAPTGSVVDLAWLLPVAPALSAALLLLVGRRIGRASAGIAIAVAGFTATMAVLVFLFLQSQPDDGRVFVREVATWLSIGDFDVAWTLLVDPLSSVMLLLVTCVGLLIHIYSLGYMAHDERYTRFFAYLNLFLAAMLVLVLGESFLVLFVGWELVGLASYLLIGFWYSKPAYASAAQKAFVVNRIGDVGFMIAMFVIFGAFGSLSFTTVLPQASSALAPAAAIAIGLLLLVAAAGKSAQIPLFVWLPDAMAGPTPVSALIHAATMVTAGVYLIARTSAIYATIPDIGMVVAWVGVLTALLAALIACAQRDIKKILAYSTVSQLGYMFMGVGLGENVGAVFHLLTHGFFKALLFLAAGSVMHAMADRTDVWGMGGLWRKMPITFATSVIAVAAIAGLPPLSGFFSKEEILSAAVYRDGAAPLWFIGIAVAGLTAFYMTRWLVLTFLGKPRWTDTGDDAVHPHESPLSMTLPLVLLGVASAIGGLINIDPETGFLHGWLTPSVVLFDRTGAFLPASVYIGTAIGIAVIGVLYAGVRYLRSGLEVPGDAVGFVKLAEDKFYVDELYERTIARPGRALASISAWVDRNGIDGAVVGAGRLTAGLATSGRRLQTGWVRSYALAVLAGAVLVALVAVGTIVFGGVS